ncbi:MAG: TIGR02678 family protein [Streptomycetales bacterium]
MSGGLTDVLDAQRDDERRTGVRALLRHPLLTPRGPDPTAFILVRRHSGWLADWFVREAGWSLHCDSGVARLRKVPGRHDDGSRAAASKTRQRFSRRRYVLTCLALAALERAETQVTLGWLVNRILGFAADHDLTRAGMAFSLRSREERGDLVAVAKVLLDTGVLVKVAGDEQAFVDQSGDALYDVDRKVLSVLLAARRGPSTVTAQDFEDRLRAITEDLVPDTDDGRNRATRHTITRRLLDDPVVYYADLTEQERTYLDRQRGPLLRRLTEATGLVAEARAEGIALLDPTREATDLGMPEEGTDGHATLLLAEHLAGCLREDPDRPVPVPELERQMAAFAAQHRTHWRKNTADPGAERELAGQALYRLTALGLIARRDDRVIPLPALARFGYGQPKVSGGANHP